jgi:hypothetical protein
VTPAIPDRRPGRRRVGGRPAYHLDDLAVKSEDGPMNARDYNSKQMGDACSSRPTNRR